MKRSLFIATVSCALLLSGCAQKEVSKKASPKGVNGTKSSSSTNRENVDRYGGDTNGYEYTSADGNGYDGDSNGMGNGGLQKIYFDVDKYMITPDKLSTIAGNAKILQKDIKAGSRVKVEGHCDMTGTDEYNYALGLRRAKATKEALVTKGIKPSAITIVSMGESSPECTTDYSSECLAKNRRVEFKVIR
jgi:peptidoglycan-associated lipoprotein